MQACGMHLGPALREGVRAGVEGGREVEGFEGGVCLGQGCRGLLASLGGSLGQEAGAERMSAQSGPGNRALLHGVIRPSRGPDQIGPGEQEMRPVGVGAGGGSGGAVRGAAASWRGRQLSG